MSWENWHKDFNQLASSTLEKPADAPRLYGGCSTNCAPLAVLRGELEAIQDGVRQFTPESVTHASERRYAYQTG